jgi:hypothetical protein
MIARPEIPNGSLATTDSLSRASSSGSPPAASPRCGRRAGPPGSRERRAETRRRSAVGPRRDAALRRPPAWLHPQRQNPTSTTGGIPAGVRGATWYRANAFACSGREACSAKRAAQRLAMTCGRAGRTCTPPTNVFLDGVAIPRRVFIRLRSAPGTPGSARDCRG